MDIPLFSQNEHITDETGSHDKTPINLMRALVDYPDFVDVR